MGTGLIYAAIVAAWAAYLVPLWLRRHDEAAASRSVDKFSDAMRVLARRKTPAYATPADEAADQLPRRPVLGPPPRTSAAARPAVSAATRRRRVLVSLVAALTVVTVLAVVALVPWWAVAIPSGVVLAFLFVSASSARAERAAAARTPRRDHGPVRRSARVTASYAHGSSVAQPGVDDEPTVIVRRASDEPATAEPAPAVAKKRDDGLWDPVEVPLPTYVTKARAPFTVRTVELGSPGTWTSGRLPEAELLLRASMDAAELIETTVQPPPPPEEELEHRRAVGD
ncbi:divisome protein SepX/GlpR [Tenggerimyces flavus]|uniref:Uncharacterized protein n=1 Tax=Tenggerimyces flavus TaxID=1708749 RepID=A0ABV7YAB4_9ACTN|nr:hypothetical protein [Tenggerimyces flavus]MBM7785538.1 hypothetical protein [Tenggerimyces flavus]